MANSTGSVTNRIIEALRRNSDVEEKKLDKLLSGSTASDGSHVLQKILDEDIVTEERLLIIMSKEMDIPVIDVERLGLNKELMSAISEKVIRKYRILPVSRIGDHMTIATSDPTDVFMIDDVRVITRCDIHPVISSSKALDGAIRNYYGGAEEDFSSIIAGSESEDTNVEVVEDLSSFDVKEITKRSEAAPIVKIVGLIISEAIKKRASDIHIEPMERMLRVRYRIDGELHEAFDLPKKNQNAIIARIKIMSNMDITENRVPQDGRFRIKLEGKEIDFRVSVLPLNFGNKIVLRALDKSNLSVGLETLGFLPRPLSDFKEAISRPYGIILVTGPTGSGKSTTLYSVLNEMNEPSRNIVTIEDPVEYQVPGLTQIATHKDIGFDFADGLRAILRQSPDIIMVGEIRDYETADIAIKASLTGQMVFSTLHTNDAVGAITRLGNMGIEPFLVASSLVLTSAQRLLRKICPYCKLKANIPEDKIREIKDKYPEARDKDDFYYGRGCERCRDTGYLGRIATLETVLLDDQLRDMIARKQSEADIRGYLREKNVRTLRENAMVKFINGVTSLEEVYRVT
jgi:type IV pilus assembly protein PilB